mmetsp:Transcript_48208/g.49058  ORF Transcript_48208/g.49058 Transcript_48208/m.49058 type:complete len:98 (+) Transcript_48208:181-474(+)
MNAPPPLPPCCGMTIMVVHSINPTRSTQAPYSMMATTMMTATMITMSSVEHVVNEESQHRLDLEKSMMISYTNRTYQRNLNSIRSYLVNLHIPSSIV